MLADASVVYRRLMTCTLEARRAGRRTAGTGAATDRDGTLRRSNI